jgi:hypothetical protein
MSVDGFRTTSVWEASVIAYLYGWDCLATISDHEKGDGTNKRVTEYFLAVPSEDAKIDIENYEAGTLALSDTKSFVHVFNNISQIQHVFRRRGDKSWASRRWVNGEIR